MHESVILNTTVYVTCYKLRSTLRPTIRECVHTVSGTDVTREIFRHHAYMPPWMTQCAHGRRSRGTGDKSPQNLEQGDANANCPPQISYRYKKERSVAFKICQYPISELMILP